LENLAKNSTSFSLNYGEFAYLGAATVGKEGIDLETSSGTISSSTIRNGYSGVYLNGSGGNTLTANNVYANSQYGIYLGAVNNNTLTSNNVYSNSLQGIFLSGSSNNTLTSNNVYSNTSHV